MGTDLGPQSRYWSTASVEPGRALKFWMDTLCAELVELQINVPRTERFEAWMLQKALGSISLNFIFTRQAQDAWHTREAISRCREARFDLVYIRSGTFNFEHYGRSFTIGRGECVLIDSSEPYRFGSSESSAGTSLQIPQQWLRSRLAAPEDGVASVITGAAPWGRALLATLDALSPESTEEQMVPGEVLAEQVASLLTLAVGKPTMQATYSQRKLLPRIRQALRAQAHDPLLTPAGVAKDHGISRRHLHAVFAAAETTFSRELMSIRLDRAHRLLGDPRSAGVGVSEIAWNCGFSDSSHFARRFHQRYGVAPRAYRQSIFPRVVSKPRHD